MASPATLTRFTSPNDLVKQLKSLPPAPKVLLKLQQMAGSDNSSVDDLVAVIRIERALAARIVQIANGPMYNLGSPCESIEESVQRLGFREVRRIALVVSGSAAMNQPLPAYGVDSQSLWHQNVACAIAAEFVARLVDEDERLAYTSGLMHSVGMIVINSWAQMLAPGTALPYQNTETEWSAAERDLLGYDQADAGAALLRAWDFPAPVVDAVRCQYAPQCSTAYRKLAATITMARWLRNVVCNRTDNEIPAPGKMSLMTLKISEQQLRDIVPDVLASLNLARQVLA